MEDSPSKLEGGQIEKLSTPAVESRANEAHTTLLPVPSEQQALSGQRTEPVFLSASEIASRPAESFPDPTHGHLTWATLLSSGLTPSDKLTAGIAKCLPNSGHLGRHHHEQAEIYFILEGEGLMKVADVERKVSKGGLVFIPGDAEHSITNLSEEENLVWLYCFPTDKFEDVVYKFPGDNTESRGSIKSSEV